MAFQEANLYLCSSSTIFIVVEKYKVNKLFVNMQITNKNFHLSMRNYHNN